jgi:hypothetical protein
MSWFGRKDPQKDQKIENIKTNLQRFEGELNGVLASGDIAALERFYSVINQSKTEIVGQQRTNSDKRRFFGASSGFQAREKVRMDTLLKINNMLDMISDKKVELLARDAQSTSATSNNRGGISASTLNTDDPTDSNSNINPSIVPANIDENYPVFTGNRTRIDITINGNKITLKVGDFISVYSSSFGKVVTCKISSFIAKGGYTTDPINTMILEYPGTRYLSIALTAEAARTANEQFGADWKTIKLVVPPGTTEPIRGITVSNSNINPSATNARIGVIKISKEDGTMIPYIREGDTIGLRRWVSGRGGNNDDRRFAKVINIYDSEVYLDETRTNGKKYRVKVDYNKIGENEKDYIGEATLFVFDKVPVVPGSIQAYFKNPPWFIRSFETHYTVNEVTRGAGNLPQGGSRKKRSTHRRHPKSQKSQRKSQRKNQRKSQKSRK